MSVQLVFKSGELTALLEGEIDHHTAREVTLDFSGVQFMDSSGVGLILGRYKLVSMWGGQVCVANMPEKLEKIVSMAGIRNLCTMVKDVEEK